MIMRTTPLLVLCAVFAAASCADPPPPKLPAKAKGCEVTVYRGAVPDGMKVTPLGEVVTDCGKNDADSDCIRALQDEVCKLGGDVVYEVPSAPEPQTDVMLRYEGIAGTTSQPH